MSNPVLNNHANDLQQKDNKCFQKQINWTTSVSWYNS